MDELFQAFADTKDEFLEVYLAEKLEAIRLADSERVDRDMERFRRDVAREENAKENDEEEEA